MELPKMKSFMPFSSKIFLHTFSPGLVLVFVLCHQWETVRAACPETCACRDDVIMCQKGVWADIEPKLTKGLERIILEKDVSGLDTIKESTFLQFKDTLKLIRISGVSLKTIGPNAFAGCKSLIDLDLSDNQLTNLDSESFFGLSNLKSLNLANNKLSSLEDVLTPLVALKTLDVTHNFIQDLSKSVFKNQSSLTKLVLNGNPIKRLTSQAFSGLNSIQEIRLRDCSIPSVEIDVFYNTPKLRFLDLGRNRFSKPLSPAILTDLTVLRTLLFDQNMLKRLEDKDFALLYLQKLDLSFNRITYIDKTAFQNLTVKELDLSENLILSLSSDFLSPLADHLTSLTLAGNPFEKLEKDTFTDFRYLERLNVSSCRLSAVDHQTLLNLPSLKALDISHNNLNSLSQDTLNSFSRLTHVNLHQNKWICDCHIKPLCDWLSKSESIAKMQCLQGRGKHQDCNILRCAAPSQFSQKQLHQIQEEQLGECPSDEDSPSLNTSTQGAIVAACLGFAIIFLIITVYLWRKGKTSIKLKRVCVPSNAESSHMIDEDSKVPPLSNCDRASLNESDHEFVVRHYFDTYVTDPKLMSRTSDSEEPKSPKERDSMYSSQPSLYNSDPPPSSAPMGIESTV